jgi:hypothetical protein
MSITFAQSSVTSTVDRTVQVKAIVRHPLEIVRVSAWRDLEISGNRIQLASRKGKLTTNQKVGPVKDDDYEQLVE